MLRPLFLFALTLLAAAAAPEPRAFVEGPYALVSGDEDFCPSRPELAYEESAGTTALHLGPRFVFTDVGADAPAAITSDGCTQSYENKREPHRLEQRITAVCKDPAKSFVKRARLEWSHGVLIYSLETEGHKGARVCKYKPKKARNGGAK